MNETLKGVAHIGAELAEAKADLQREMERHRKTWRHLDSLRDVAREALAVIERLRPEGNGMGTIVRLKAALSQQAEPAKPVYPPKETWPEWANWCGLDPSGYWVFYEREPVTSDVGRTPSGGSWGKPVKDEPQPCWQVMLYPRNVGQHTEPAPAQDERAPASKTGIAATIVPVGSPSTEDVLWNALIECRNAINTAFKATTQQAALAAIDEAMAFKQARATRPAQTEQQPVAVPEDFQPLETIRWWISAYTNPENGPSYQGHGMMVQMLCEYEALRIMLSSRAQQRPTAYPHEAMDKLATDRYRVGAAGAGTLHGFAVRAGDGEQELYRGSKSDCEHVARKLAGAFLDGGVALQSMLAAPIAQTAPSCNHRFMYFGDQTKRRCADCYVVEGNAQTAPQMPERLPVEPYKTVDRSSTNYKAGWNACRKAMLEGQTALSAQGGE